MYHAALGFGNNVDYEIVWNSHILETLVRTYDIRPEEVSSAHPVIDERDLVVSILGFVASGAGGERIVADSEVLENFAARFEKAITLGGTSVRAAIAMHKLGVRSALHLVTANDDVRERLPGDCTYVCSSEVDSLHPHLIVQFPEDAVVRIGALELRAQRANRIIYHRDEDNIGMHLEEGFADLLGDAKLCLVSGFNAMRNKTLLTKRLESLGQILSRLPPGAVVFYEDAGYHTATFRQLVLTALAGKNLIVSMNEDELQDILGRKLDLFDPAAIIAALQELKPRLPSADIVVHTRYWALAFGDNAAALKKALRVGTAVATARFCVGDALSAETYEQTLHLSPDPLGARFADDIGDAAGTRLSCVPVASVEQTRGTTIGLGDAFVGGFLAALLTP